MESGQLNYTWYGKAKQLVGVGISGTEHFDNIDYFWYHAYQKINTISVSSWILFFIIFYLIATYIKYSLKHSEDKSLTYKQILKKDESILYVTIVLSTEVSLLVHRIIDWNNPFPPTIGYSITDIIINFGSVFLSIYLIIGVILYIILFKKKEEHPFKKAFIDSIKLTGIIIFTFIAIRILLAII